MAQAVAESLHPLFESDEHAVETQADQTPDTTEKMEDPETIYAKHLDTLKNLARTCGIYDLSCVDRSGTPVEVEAAIRRLCSPDAWVSGRPLTTAQLEQYAQHASITLASLEAAKQVSIAPEAVDGGSTGDSATGDELSVPLNPSLEKANKWARCREVGKGVIRFFIG